ncbi:hypothetical protein IE996_05695 [Klebsiella pneumoniae]|uniref:Uncharacterized protein n=1 Tax=Klebsiella pneumoniae TaxID=573 RepID=A0A927HNX4_KLEPN|nr:hypothetical protein [Klebsiella pneumoniae]
MAPYPGYALVPYFCRVAATPYPALVIGAQFAPFVGPRKRSAAGQSLRLLLRLRQLADDRLAPRIPFR